MKKALYILFLPLLAPLLLRPQLVLIDEGIRAGGLWCFPVHNQENSWRYLPSDTRLALDTEQHPQFSFLRYIMEKPANGGEFATINQASGGAILHFLVHYDTPAEKVKIAEEALRNKLDNDDLRLSGPIVFERGQYALVSSILIDGAEEKQLIGSGTAPILENSSIALTFELNPMRSKLLLESFKMPTSDLSLVFELSFSGLTSQYEAQVDVNWSELYESEHFNAGANLYFISADVETGLDQLIKNNAIRVVTIGESDHLGGLLTTVYEKLTDLLFEKTDPRQLSAGDQGRMANNLFDFIGDLANPRKLFGIGAEVAYRRKAWKTEGASTLKFNGRQTVQRNHFIVFNAGDLYSRYGSDQRFFKDVPMYDPAFQQRTIHIGIDGRLENEFAGMINNVVVRLRKLHGNGNMTIEEILVDERVFADAGGHLKMQYLNQADSNRMDWLRYEYQTLWQFTGGATFTTPWRIDSTSMINLYVPFRRVPINFDGNLDRLAENGVRAVAIRLEYPFFDRNQVERLTLRPGDNPLDKSLEITLPLDQEAVNYKITWFTKDGANPSVEGKDQYGLIFFDEMN